MKSLVGRALVGSSSATGCAPQAGELGRWRRVATEIWRKSPVGQKSKLCRAGANYAHLLKIAAKTCLRRRAEGAFIRALPMASEEKASAEAPPRRRAAPSRRVAVVEAALGCASDPYRR